MSYRLTVYIAEIGTPLRLEGNTPSMTGHMWWSINNGGTEESYGFAPTAHGEAFWSGKVYTNDIENYAQTSYKESISITESQFKSLHNFGNWPYLLGFNTEYNGLTNSCVDFTWAALRIAGVNPQGFQGLLLPSWNKSYLERAWEKAKEKAPDHLREWDYDFEYTLDGQVKLHPFCRIKPKEQPTQANSSWQQAVTFAPRDPLAIDLTGDGIKTVAINTTTPILFDHNGDGAKSATGWLDGSDAWLVRDINTNGSIDSGLELFGVDTDITVNNVTRKATNGFEALAALDANGDKVFNTSDAAFTQVRLWQDLNQNGASDAGELSTLTDKGITGIALNFTSTNTNLGNGNTVTSKAVVTRSTGTSEIDSVSVAVDSAAYNLNLADNPFYSQLPSVPLTSTATALPEMHGSGSVHGLREAMSLGSTQTTTLINTVTQFAAATTRDAQMALLDQLVQQWGATSSLTTSSPFVPGAPDEFTLVNPSDPMGQKIQTFARANPALYHKIIALEQFNGQTGLRQLITRWGTNLPSGVTSSLESAYAALRESTYGALALQTRLKPYFDAITLTVSDSGVAFDTSGLQSKLEAAHSLNVKAAIADLIDLNKFSSTTLNAVGFDGLAALSTWVSAYNTDLTATTYLTGLGIVLAQSNTGTESSDLFVGDAGSSQYYARNGDDTLFGGAGHDWLDGEAGNDELIGGSGDDELYGEAGADTLDGGAGNDFLRGGAGADTYLFYKGAGHDIIENKDADSTEANPDCIAIGPGITTSSVTLARDSDNLIIKLNDSDDELVVRNYFYKDGTWYGATQIKFDDDTIWDLNAIKVKVSLPTDGRDILYGYSNNNDTINSGDGNDIIYGYAGNDVLDGSTGADNIQGGDGNDSINGGANDDSLYGGTGNDIILGDAHNDTLYGDAGNDTLDGGTGNDALSGDTGADTYLFGIGSGQDTISNADSDAIGTNADCILLGAGITSTDVSLVRKADDLIIKLNGRDDTLSVQRYFEKDGASSWAVENIKFADNTIWDINTVKARTLASTIGIVGNDSFSGAAGANTYLFGIGSGQDTINNADSDAIGTNADCILLGTGITNTDVTLLRQSDDLIIKLNGRDDTLCVQSYFKSDGASSNVVESLKFADGTVWDINTVKARALAPTTGNDKLYGYATNDAINGGDGNDFIDGRNGDDVLDGSSGADSIQGGEGNDDITGGTGNDTIFGGAGNDNLFGNEHDDYLYGDAGNDNIQGQEGNDNLYGGSGNDTLDGGADNDILAGDTGNDTYLFGKGSGKDTLSAYDLTVGKLDVIQLGSDVLTTDVTLKRDRYINREKDDLAIFINGTTDKLLVRDYFIGDATSGRQVELIKFTDGTIWDINTVKAKVLTASGESDLLFGYDTAESISGQAGEDTLYGERGDDTLIGGSQDDELDGGFGNDTYIFGRGDGHDIISDRDYTVGNTDTLQFSVGIASSDIRAVRDVNDLLLTVKGSYDQVTVQDFFDGTTASQIEQFTYSDHAAWTVATINDLVNALEQSGTANTDTLTGSANVDLINSSSGNDTLTALAGNDFLFGGEGNDSLDGGADNDWLWGEAGNDKLDGGTGADTMLGGLGDDSYTVDNVGDVVIESANGGRDTVRTSVNYVASDNIELIFASGTDNINLTGCKTTGTQLSGNAGTNVLTGGSGADRFYSRGGADTMIGGDSNDVYFVDSANTQIVETVTGGTADAAYVYIDNYVIPNYVDLVNLTGSAAISCYGNNFKSTIRGNSQNNYLYGAGGLDFLQGGDGNDTLRGGTATDFLYGDAGDDLYLFAKNDGKDYITNNDAAGHDTLLLENANESQVWLQKSGNDLLVSVIGTSDSVSVKDWYLNANSQVDDIKVGASGKVLNASKVDALVQAMSTLTPPAAGQTTLPQTYQDKLNGVIAASWA